MPLTTTQRERFLPAGTTLVSFNATTDQRTPAAPGNFTAVTGTFYNRPVGPAVVGDSFAGGWSADVRGNGNYGLFQFTDLPTRNAGETGAWFYFDTFSNDAANKVQLIRYTRDSDGAEIGCLLLDNAGKLYLRSNNQGTTVQVDTAPQNAWVCYVLAWVRTAANTYKRAVYRKLAGQGMTQVYLQGAADTGFESATLDVRIGSKADGGTAAASFRLGAPFLSSFTQTDFSDAGYPADLIDPPASTRQTWYVRADGNDNNHGLSGAAAWATVGKVFTETQNAGVFRAASGTALSATITYASGAATLTAVGHGYASGQLVAVVGASPGWLNQVAAVQVVDANTCTYAVAAPPPGGSGAGTASGMITCQAFALGDTLVIDSVRGGGPVDFGTASLDVRARGATVQFVGSPMLRRTLPNAGWVLAGGSTKTWQLADGADLTGVVVWENELWLTHPSGASFAAVQATMDATPGSFYSDGTNLYLHPFGDTNPNTDGKTYTRSRNRNAGAGDSAVLMNADDVQVIGDATYPPTLKGTALARSTDGDPYNAYLVQFGATTGGGGICRLSNLALDYGGKHLAGNTGNKVAGIMCRDGVTYGQATPYPVTGGQTQDVDFCATGSANVYVYTNCGGSVNAGLVGSAAGRVNYAAYASWISHGSASTYAGGWFNNCSWPAGFAEQGVTTGTLFVSGGSSAGSGFGLGCSLTVVQHRASGDPFSTQGTGKTCTILNSVMAITDAVTNFYWAQLRGTLVCQGVTIDLRGNTTSSGSARAVWSKLTSAAATIQDTVFLVDTGKDFTLLDSFANTDTIAMDHNVYQLGSGAKVMRNYNDGSTTADRTFAQWQALGKDAGSLSPPDAKVSPTDRPQWGSPAIAAGVALASLSGTRDAFGTLRPATGLVDAGAATYVRPISTPFPPAVGMGFDDAM